MSDLLLEPSGFRDDDLILRVVGHEPERGADDAAVVERLVLEPVAPLLGRVEAVADETRLSVRQAGNKGRPLDRERCTGQGRAADRERRRGDVMGPVFDGLAHGKPDFARGVYRHPATGRGFLPSSISRAASLTVSVRPP